MKPILWQIRVEVLVETTIYINKITVLIPSRNLTQFPLETLLCDHVAIFCVIVLRVHGYIMSCKEHQFVP
jgi:hypothetical protein